ncbi:amino acid/polyamine transporter I [Aspergillus ambiguus]|uniref:amino acid/polyamine transporter I n=1 Tax=Aspergillus ambiguus TaxID=176160 RepID=UPI003CCD272A
MGIGEVKPKVHFGLISAIGVQYSVTGAPIAIGTYLSLTIGLGGSAAYFWGYVMMGFFQLTTCLAMCELASAIPHSSGPAYWVTVLGPPRYGRTLGYIMGWLTNAGWFFISSACVLYAAQLTMAIVEVAHPDFTIETWQTYLVYCAYSVLCFSINLPRTFKIVHYLLTAVIFILNGTAIWLLVALLARAHPKQNAHAVFIEFVNESGWSSDGAVFFLALLPAYACLAGLDNATHLADEMENPKKQIPQVIMGSFAMNYFTALPMIVVYEFCNVEPESMLDPVGGQPMIQLMVNAFRSLPLTIVTTAVIIYGFFVASASSLITWARLTWSFSRDGSLPFSRMMAKLTSRDSLPVNALSINTVVLIALGAISIGSSTAMNALLGAANVCIVSAIVTAFGLALYRGRKSFDPDRWFNLGRWGDAIFWLSTLWSVFMTVMLSMPLYLPVTPAYMNWTCVVFGGVVVLAAIYWFAVFSRIEVAYSSGDHGEEQENHRGP